MPATWIDFKELRRQLRFSDVLRHYNVQIKVKGERGTGFCPLPGHQSRENGKRHSPSFSAHLTKGIFQCFSCGAKGNAIDFACRMEGLNPDSGQDIRKIALMLQERFGNGSRPAPQPACKKSIEKPEAKSEAHENAGQVAPCPAIVNAPLDFELRHIDPTHPYLAERGFTPETIAHFGLGYCSRGLMQGRIVIPLHDAAGKLIGYAGRLVDDKAISDENPKYLFPGRREKAGEAYEFHKSLFLYNGFQIGDAVDDLIVVEGFASVWWLWQAGLPNVVALMGSDVSRDQINLLAEKLRCNGRAWVFTDGDDAGRRCARRLLVRVAPHRLVRWVKLRERKQPTDLSPGNWAKFGLAPHGLDEAKEG